MSVPGHRPPASSEPIRLHAENLNRELFSFQPLITVSFDVMPIRLFRPDVIAGQVWHSTSQNSIPVHDREHSMKSTRIRSHVTLAVLASLATGYRLRLPRPEQRRRRLSLTRNRRHRPQGGRATTRRAARDHRDFGRSDRARHSQPRRVAAATPGLTFSDVQAGFLPVPVIRGFAPIDVAAKTTRQYSSTGYSSRAKKV
jgi:hypothetical protein